MDAKTRFNKIMDLERPDRPPLFEDGIREEVLKVWHAQGLGKRVRLSSLFQYDLREEIEPDLEPRPSLTHWSITNAGLEKLKERLDPGDPGRLPDGWEEKVKQWKKRDYPLILRIHRGYFLSMGVHGWRRFTDSVRLLVDDPKFVGKWMNLCGEFSAQMAERILQEVEVDAVIFSEPIGGNHGPLISPKMYSDIVLKSYQPVFEVLKRFGVKIIILRTYANTRILLPEAVKFGFNCLWACECNAQAMDYKQIRQEYGRELRLIGGIDSDTLRQNQQDIFREVMEIVPPLLEDGGFIPLADGRVREDVTFENYTYYRRLLESVVGSNAHS